MMRAEHYAEAERLLHVAGLSIGRHPRVLAEQAALVAQAQVHATLAGVDVAVAR